MSYDINYCKKYEPFFGSWYAKRKLGEGNFGAVFAIEREDFGTKYHAALKVISIPKNRSELDSIMNDTLDEIATERYLEQVVERIVREFELMAKLKGNTNVVSYEDHQVIKHSDDAGWDILIRMELLTPMLSYFKTREITRADIVGVGIDICRALELCEKHNIVHRDIKPENIFVSESGDFKLGDFGIAKQVEESQAEQTKIGTPSYMAPEVVKGHKYDASVDMYSLGVVLYRFLNHNRTPFMPPFPNEISYGDKDRAFGERVNSGKPFPMPTNVGSKELAKIILKACSYNPKDRYSSPAEMRKALENVLAKEKREILAVPVISNGAHSDVVAPPIVQDDNEKTELMESQNKYEVGGNETVVLDNTTDGSVSLRRVGNDPLGIVITGADGSTSDYPGWTESTIRLSAGDKLQITNTGGRKVVFYGQFGDDEKTATLVTNKNGGTSKSKLVPILVAIIAALVVLIVVFALPGKDAGNSGGSDVAVLPGNDDVQDVFNDEQDEDDAEVTIMLSDLDNVPETIELVKGRVYMFEPEPVPYDAEFEGVVYESSDESVAEAYSDGTVYAVSKGEAIITLTCGDVVKEVKLTVVPDIEKLVLGIESALSSAMEDIESIKGISDKDLSSVEGRIESVEEALNSLQGLDLESESGDSLDNYNNILNGEILPEIEALMKETESLETVETCSYCGSTEHTVHPRCNVCGSYNHTTHPKCNICGSYDHTTHPQCPYCGSYDHTTHPKCNICGSMDHAVHPAISADL